MYDNILTSSNDYLSSSQAVPQNTNADGDEGSKRINGSLGALQIVVKCKTAITLAASKTLTLTVKDSADDSSFSTIVTEEIATGSGLTYAADDVIARLAIPSDA